MRHSLCNTNQTAGRPRDLINKSGVWTSTVQSMNWSWTTQNCQQWFPIMHPCSWIGCMKTMIDQLVHYWVNFIYFTKDTSYIYTKLISTWTIELVPPHPFQIRMHAAVQCNTNHTMTQSLLSICGLNSTHILSKWWIMQDSNTYLGLKCGLESSNWQMWLTWYEAKPIVQSLV